MTRNLWIASAAAVAMIIAAGLAYMAEIRYLPSILIFIAAIVVVGVSMMEEDVLIQKYDTPHDEDRHPPALILFRFGRGIILGILLFVLAF